LQTVYRGDGTRQTGTFVGLAAYANVLAPVGTQGEGPNRVAIAPDGSIYAVGGFGHAASLHTVVQVAPSGFATVVAGQEVAQPGYDGDGGPATQALLAYPEDVELGPDGSVYIADTRNHRVRKVTPDGIIRTIAGSGTPGFSGDGGPAASAQLNWPAGLALGSDGALYIADRDNWRVRRIGTDGNISTVAGHGNPGGGSALPLEDVAATELGDWMHPADVAVEADGALLVSDPITSVIRRVNTKGRVSTVAGIACLGGCTGSDVFFDGVPATQTPIGYPQGIVTLPDRSYYFADSLRGYVHYVDPEGIHHLIAGGGTIRREAAGVAARTLDFVGLYGVAVGPAGIVIPDRYWGRLITLRPAALPPLGTTDAIVASRDGSEVYQFDSRGRHQTTRDAITGAIRYQFGYESHGYLASVTDAYANVMSIERSASGTATAVVGPYGQRTELSYDANGYLAGITNPVGQSVGMSYTSTGLLTAFQNARGHSSVVSYDDRGRLVSDQDAAGGAKTLTRTELSDGWKIDLATTDAGTRTLEVHKLVDGREQRNVTFADGSTTQETRALDGTFTTTLADGTLNTSVRSADPRYGLETPVQSRMVRLPSGLTYTETSQRTVTLTNQLDPLSVSALTNERTINGKLWRESYDATTKTWTLLTPTGRRTFRRINTLGDLVEDRTDTLLARILAYDAQGRLSTMTQGSRLSLFSYFTSGASQGYLQTSRNPVLQTTTFARDAIGRALSELDPAGNLSQFTWDPDGNLASVAPP
jgi:YD repeat-containing protein